MPRQRTQQVLQSRRNIEAQDSGSSSEDEQQEEDAEDVSSSESDEESSTEDKSLATMDGTEWQRIAEGNSAGRPPAYNTFNLKSGPIAYCMRSIAEGHPLTAFKLLISDSMMAQIVTNTSEEALRAGKVDWSVDLKDMWSFVDILIARGAFEMKNVDINLLWSSSWGPSFFPK